MTQETKTTHTPGPWKWINSGLVASSIKNKFDRLIVFEWRGKVGCNNSNDEALIAAAPDLLEAAKQAQVALFMTNGSQNDAYRILDAAINKAEGGELK